MLKIANSSEQREILELQNACLEHLHRRDPQLRVPEIIRGPAGELVEIRSADHADGGYFLARLVSFLPGRPMKDVSPHTPALLEAEGEFFGRMDSALETFSHPAMNRRLYWDLRHATEVISESMTCSPPPAGDNPAGSR